MKITKISKDAILNKAGIDIISAINRVLIPLASLIRRRTLVTRNNRMILRMVGFKMWEIMSVRVEAITEMIMTIMSKTFQGTEK